MISLPYCDGAGTAADRPEGLQALIAFAAQELTKDTQGRVELRNASTKTVKPETLFVGQKVRMLLDLAASPDEQMANFKSKLRSQIRKAEKNGLRTNVIGFDDTESFTQSVDEFYEVISGNMHTLSSPVHAKVWFLSVLSEYAHKAYMVLVYKDDIALGGGIVLMNNKTASIPWASTKAQYNKLAPNMLLYWTVLTEAITQGAQVFAFGRSTLNEGTYKFKKQWGSEPTPLHWNTYANEELIELAEKGSTKIREAVEVIWRKLPTSMVNYVGPRVRKYVTL